MVISASIITILASLILTIIYWRVNKVYVYLLVLMLSMSLYAILHQLILYDGEVLPATIIYGHFAPIFYLPGPMLFFFIRGILEDREDLRLKNRKELLHFLPFVITLIGIWPYMLLPFDYKLRHVSELIQNPMLYKSVNDNWLIPSWANTILRSLILVLYCIGSFFIIRRYQLSQKLKQPHVYHIRMTLQWLYALVSFIFTIGITYFIISALFLSVADIREGRAVFFFPSVLVVVLLLIIPVLVAIFPQLLYGIPVTKKYRLAFNGQLMDEEEAHQDSNSKHITEETERMDYPSDDNISSVPLERDATEILLFVETHKLYLDPDFNMEKLAKAMKIPRNHLYYCFSNLISEKFTSYRTRLRVEYAKKLLLGGAAESHSMEGIASESGFRSRSRFFSSFKEITGLTPMEFLEQHPTKNEPGKDS